MATAPGTSEEMSFRLRIAELEARLYEAEETLEAIRSGEVDAIVVGRPEEQRVYTIETADRPYRVLVEQMQEGAVTLAADSTVLYCNQRLAEILRTSQERIIGSSMFKFVPDFERAAYEQLLGKSAHGGGKGEFSLVAGDGSILPVYLSVIDLVGDDKRVLCGIVTDLTQQKQRISELAHVNRKLVAESEERARAENELSQFFEVSPDPLLISELDGRFKRLNPAWEDTLGHSHADLISARLVDLVHPDDREKNLQEFAVLARGEAVFGSENRYRHKDGSWRILQWNAQPRSGLVYSAMRDVTSQRQAEALRRKAEQSLQIALEASEMGSWDLDLIADTARRSLRHDQIFGHETLLPEWGQQSFIRYVVPEDREDVAAAFGAAERTGALEFVCRVQRASDGLARWIRVKGQTYFDGGRPIRMAGVIADITEQRHLEDQLRQAQKMEAVGQLTSGLAHDFNNLLTVILGNLERVKARMSDDKLAQQIDHARQAAERGAGLTQQLLAFSRRQSLSSKTICINDLLPGLELLIRRAIGEKIELNLADGEELWHCHADPNQVEASILNLAINARDAMPLGGLLTIATANVVLSEADTVANPEVAPGRYVMVSVADTGEGMRPEILSRVFEPFFTTKEVGKGSGLGLSMVYGFARQSGGHVAIDSEVGHGTTIRLYLPWSEDDLVEEAQTPAESVPPLRAAVVLVVEDDPHVRPLVVQLVADLGHSVLKAENATDALEIVEREPDLEMLFTDIAMPNGMNGLDLAREVHRRRPDIAVLLTSGHTAQSLARNGVMGEEFRIIRKPYRNEELAVAINGALAESQERRARAAQADEGAAGSRILVVEDDALVSMVLEDMLTERGFQIIGPFALLPDALAAAEAAQCDAALLDVNLGNEAVYPVADMLASRGIPFAFMTGHDSRNLPEPYRFRPSLSKPYTAKHLEHVLATLLGRVDPSGVA